MLCLAMGVQWNTYGIQFSCFAILVLFLGIQGCWSLNLEGLALLEFRARVDYDPSGIFANWNSNDNDPCTWSGVHCVDSKVENLDLRGLSLVGVLVPNLGKLFHLRSLVLYDNHFFGAIPKEIGGLTMLEVLDLRNNHLTGAIPAEIGGLQSLKHLLLCNNNFEGEIPLGLWKLNFLSDLQFDENLKTTLSTGIGSVNRKFGHWFKSGRDSSHSPEYRCSGSLPGAHKIHLVQNVQNLVNIARRGLLQLSSNLAALPATGTSPPEQITTLPTTRSSGSFPAVPKAKKGQSNLPVASSTSPSPLHDHATSNPDSWATGSANKSTSRSPSSGNTWKYIVLTSGITLLFIVAAVMFFMCRKQPVTNIGPWKTGLSGQLQKAFVTGVPKLNRAELETACEDFSNIIDTIDGCTIYKGTLSSGVEIAVASSAMLSAKDWTKRSELSYRKKIDTLSRVNHKNFVNLIGFCEEEEPFSRMMVFEYAPNGTLFEHLHVKEVEHLDWSTRMRIIMGTAYCLQYMHELNPPVAHSNLNSNSIFMTNDYAAKIAEISIGPVVSSKEKTSEEDESEHSELPPLSDPETNVYSFGIMLLEIISGKVPCSEEGPLVLNWAAEYLDNKRRHLVDPTLTSFKDSELDIICETIRDCIQQDARKRPTMREITSKLNEVIGISPDQATPRLSPLWWAELEILSSEAN